MRKMQMDQVRQAIRDSSETSSIMIGCDSKRYRDKRRGGQRMVAYARVVIIHIDSKHGCMVFGETIKEVDYGNLRGRLMREATLATELAYELLEDIGDRRMAVHLDINSDVKEPSNVAMKDANGLVMGMLGIPAVFKPDALAASICADKLMRK